MKLRLVPFKLPRPTLRDRPKWNEDKIHRAFFAYEDDLVEQAATAVGGGPSKPDLDPEMPDDTTALGSRALGALHAEFVAIGQWLDWEVVKLELKAAKHDAYLKHVYSVVHLTKSGTVEDKKNKANSDENYCAEEVRAFQATAKAKLLRARLRGYERCAAALSREMSRRELEHRQ